MQAHQGESQNVAFYGDNAVLGEPVPCTSKLFLPRPTQAQAISTGGLGTCGRFLTIAAMLAIASAVQPAFLPPTIYGCLSHPLSLSLFPLSFLIFLISTPLLAGSAESRMPCSAQGAVEDLHSSWTQHLLGEQTGSLPHPCSHSPKSKFWSVQLPELPQELSAAARGNGNILSKG